MPDASEEVLAFPDTQARQLAGVSMRRLRYWEQVGLVVPSVKRRLSDHNTVRLYSYQDLLALLVVAALRTDRNMSLQKIRRVVRSSAVARLSGAAARAEVHDRWR